MPILSPLIEQKITKHLDSKSFSDLSKLLRKIRKNFAEIVDNSLSEIKTSGIEYLTEAIDKCLASGSQHEFERTFESRFSSVRDLLSDGIIDSFKSECRD